MGTEKKLIEWESLSKWEMGVMVIMLPIIAVVAGLEHVIAKLTGATYNEVNIEICKKFAGNQVNEKGNVPRCGVVPTFSDLEVVALSITAEAFSIDSDAFAYTVQLTYPF